MTEYSGLVLVSFLVPLMPVKINRWQKIHNSIFPPTSCTAIVPWNNPTSYSSTLGLPRFTNFLSAITGLTTYHLGVVVGLLLGDAHLRQPGNGHTARVVFRQSIIHFPYVWFVWTIIAPFCASLPSFELTPLNDKLFGTFTIATRAYNVIGLLASQFIVEGIKVIPADIFNLLCPVAFAHWIMCDGSRGVTGNLILCTDSFTVPDVVRLMNVLLIRYNIESSLTQMAFHGSLFQFGKYLR